MDSTADDLVMLSVQDGEAKNLGILYERHQIRFKTVNGDTSGKGTHDGQISDSDESVEFPKQIPQGRRLWDGPPEKFCAAQNFLPNLTGRQDVRLIERTDSDGVVVGGPGHETRQKT